MRTIKVKFIGFWGDFRNDDNFIINALRKKYQVELSDEPDYLFYAGYNADIYKYDCIRIAYTFENFIPDFNLCDYAIGFAYIDFEDRYFRYPLYLNDGFTYYENDDYGLDMKRMLEKHRFSEQDMKTKEGFCSFMVSSAVDKVRNDFFERLSQYKTVASGGRYKNNVGGPVKDKFEFQKKYKFAICFENSSSPGYTTEKLMQAFAAKTVPIYYGSPRIGEEFNTRAFVNLHDFDSFDEAIEKIKEIDNNDELYMDMLKEPALNPSNIPQKRKEDFEVFLYSIVDREYKKAFRRNRSDFGKKYEKKNRLCNRYYNICLRINNWIHNVSKSN